MRNKLILLFFITLSACKHQPKLQIESPTEFVFPDGVYKQNIYVKYLKNEKSEENNFKGVLKKENLDLQLYCYVGFGITLFKIIDVEQKPLQFLTEQSEIEKNKTFFLKIYPLIKDIIYMKKSDIRFKDKFFKFQMKPDDFWVDVRILVDGKSDFPQKMTIENSNYFSFEIVNTEYSRN